MGRYGKIIETYLKENQNRFDVALDTNMPIDKYVGWIDDCIRYDDYHNHSYTESHILNNTYSTVLAMGVYT